MLARASRGDRLNEKGLPRPATKDISRAFARSIVRRTLRSAAILLVLIATLFGGCFGRDRLEPGSVSTEIRWTEHGIPHITASDWKGIGLGYGYAFARDNLCTLAEEIVTVNGERSKYFGEGGLRQKGAQGPQLTPGLTNIQSDFFFNLYNQHPELIRSVNTSDNQDVTDSLNGFVAGYNRYLETTPPSDLPSACRDEPWLRPITFTDMVRRINKLQLFASGYQFSAMMYDSQPPLPDAGMDSSSVSQWDLSRLPDPTKMGLGSNGYAFGKDMTESGAGMLLGNPHFPWHGPERFHQAHFTIPGQMDVMGITLFGVPLIVIGFTDEFAWTHTVSTGWRFGLYEIQLSPDDPTSYLYDGAARRMDKYPVTVESVDAGGRTVTRTRDYYFTHYGPVLSLDLVAQAPGVQGLSWDASHAYTFRDANAGNNRVAEQFYRFDTATTFDEFLVAAKEVLGIPWVNTIAASRDGRAFYGDLSVTPNVPADLLTECNTATGRALFQYQRLPVLDGSRSACAWREDERAPQPGIIPAEELPTVVRDDYVINSNDSHWLPNPRAPLEGFSPMIGAERTERTGRTRMGYVLLEERLAGSADCQRDPGVDCSKLTLGRLQDTLFSSRLFYPENVRDDLVAQACLGVTIVPLPSGRLVDIAEACRVLAAWDLRADLDSRGTALFEVFWPRAPRNWATPFDASDPIHTPRDYMATLPNVRQALAEAVAKLADAEIPLDAAVRDVRYVMRNGERIPTHGASDGVGSPSMMVIPFVDGQGFNEVVHGNSYIQTVTFDQGGAVAQSILTYSQSTDPASPFYSDQTEMFSQKQWVTLPFHESDVAAATTSTLVFSERVG
jgi:acyl-homoserine-lactone acylase